MSVNIVWQFIYLHVGKAKCVFYTQNVNSLVCMKMNAIDFVLYPGATSPFKISSSTILTPLAVTK